MLLSQKALASAAGVLWGAAILCVGIIHMYDPSYGAKFMQITGYVYPGIHVTGTAGRIAIRTVEGFVDGAIAGFVLAWLYKTFTRFRREV